MQSKGNIFSSSLKAGGPSEEAIGRSPDPSVFQPHPHFTQGNTFSYTTFLGGFFQHISTSLSIFYIFLSLSNPSVFQHHSHFTQGNTFSSTTFFGHFFDHTSTYCHNVLSRVLQFHTNRYFKYIPINSTIGWRSSWIMNCRQNTLKNHLTREIQRISLITSSSLCPIVCSEPSI